MVIRNFPKFIEELNKKLKKRKIGFVSAEQCEYVVNREKFILRITSGMKIQLLLKNQNMSISKNIDYYGNHLVELK